MSDLERRFHEAWLGMVQPVDGLVVSVPVLIDKQCIERHPATHQHTLHTLAPHIGADEDALRRVADLDAFFEALLDLPPGMFDRGEALPEELSLWIPEGQQNLAPTLALRKLRDDDDEDAAAGDGIPDDSTPASRAGKPYVMLVWDLPAGLDLDSPETVTGPWHYPPSAKFDRLLRATRVPIGLLTNREVFRLVYAPHGESSGSITFRVDDMATVGGRPILDAFTALLSGQRFFGVHPDNQLPAILRESRARQADVTNALAEQVFEAIHVLLGGFEAAAARDRSRALDEALERGDDHLYGGLLTVLMRLVFLLYAEDRGLMPTESAFYQEHMSVLGLFDQLQDDAGAFPDTMHRRFGAWPRLLALFRAVFLGMAHPEFTTPPRRGRLFDPHIFPFLEGWGPAGGAPITLAEDRAGVNTPSVDDATVFGLLERLLLLDGQRLSYRALDVEQIGSVYERLMGYHVVRLDGPGVCIGSSRVWVTPQMLAGMKRLELKSWLKDEADLSNYSADKLSKDYVKAKDDATRLALLEDERARGTERARAGKLVIQPGSERRRTSSHYTPRSLSSRIVRRTLQPLLLVMGEAPSSERLLELKVCDPAMGSGAFLVEACRFLADQVVAAWTREGVLDQRVPEHLDPLTQARRLVAQRCLYGVDKNAFAVDLAKLSMWLVTLARDEPFTFVDHALRHGDSLVGLDLDQIRGFHWSPSKQMNVCRAEIDAALAQALDLRRQILDLAREQSPRVTREKEWLLANAEDAMERARLIGDVIVGAFFSESSKSKRDTERKRRSDLVTAWLHDADSDTPPAELLEMQRALRAELPVFHWMLEFPEIFHSKREDPLEDGHVNQAAYMDAFVGNPPFAGKNNITANGGPHYLKWLQTVHDGAHGNADLSAHFFLRAAHLLGTHGTIGLIATNTIAQGDTRDTGLKKLVGEGFEIYDATESMPWPGEAAVTVSVVHLAHGTPQDVELEKRLNGVRVEAINTRLRPKPERPDPVTLKANANLSFQGSIVLGMGFTLTPEERNALVDKDPRNAERIFPYLGGKEVNSTPTQTFHRYVINFGQMELKEAEKWPDLIGIVRELVKPERDTNKRAIRRKYWWRFAEPAPSLYASISELDRCLVTARVSSHSMFSFQPVGRVYSDMLYVFPFSRVTHFALLQSRIHEMWARLHASSMETRLRYTASSCFETFPFPPEETLAEGGALDQAGEALYTKRAAYMVETDQGLTDTYNRLKDPTCDDPEIEELRRLHEAMDKAVLAAYGWEDINVPVYGTPSSEEEERAWQAFEDEVIDRLFVLNAERARVEKVLGR